MAGAPDMSFWLGRKYAILQQQADATTKNADTAQMTGAAQANLDRTRANLLPGESAASIAKMGAETGLIGEQAKIVAPESKARIRNMDASTEYTGTQNTVLRRQSLTPMSQLFGSPDYEGVLGGSLSRGTFGGFQLPSLTRPGRLPGESGADYMDRTNWGPY